ncbi:MAG TPA: IS110 family transposase [Hanamia sp.]|nr:IS110 family transposase [Hanamia sp.]
MTKIKDFKGTTIFCGLDVHKVSWRVNIRDTELELKDFTQPADPNLLHKHLTRNYPGAKYKVGYEAGFCGFGIQRELSALGIECVLLNAADIPKGDKDRRQKNDKRDARSISQELSTKKDLRSLYVPSPAWEYARTLVRNRQQQISDSTRCKCRIWHFLYFSSLPIPDKAETGQYWSRKFIKKLEDMDCGGSAELKAALQLKIQDHLHKREMVLQSTRAIRKMYRQEAYWPLMQLILSIPGIGEINAAIILFELQDILRFKTFDNLCSYVGLVPDTDDSGETKKNKGLTHRRNTYLREALIESSWVLVKKDPAMLMKYKDYCKRMHKNKAIIKITRHLLARISYVLRKQTPYVSGLVAG